MSYIKTLFDLGHAYQNCEEAQLLIDGARQINVEIEGEDYQSLLDQKQAELNARIIQIDFLIMTIAQQN